MTLPTSRNTTLSAASPFPSSLANALQDMVVGFKRPSITRWIQPTPANIPNQAGTSTLAANSIVGGSAWQFRGMNVGHVFEGDRITGIALRLLGTGGAQSLTFLLNYGSGAALTSLGTLTVATPPASWATYSLAFATPHVMAVGESLSLDLTSGTLVGTTLGPIGIVSDRL